MARISQEFIDQVRERNDIVEVVAQYVPLKAKGRRHWGCCPFHGEKTPSFSVSQDQQFYYCFGCHQGGNVIQFVQNMEKLEFMEALEKLADRVGMAMPQPEQGGYSGPSRGRQQAAWDACKAAARWYHEQLMGPQGAEALKYLTDRGISLRMIRRFGLGYAPEGWHGLMDAMKAQGVQENALLDARLISESNGRRYDAFRNRIMYPILDNRDRVIAFGGRVMDGSQPKYLNSPDTLIYNKRKNLYGINLIKKLPKVDKLILTEGYMDVIALQQAGYPAAIASLGTALTREQALLIKRYTSQVYLAYDGDSAGQKATLRGMDILAQEGLRVRVVRLPEGLDPDDLARTQGFDGVAQCLDEAMELTDYKLYALKRGVDMSDREARREYALTACREVIATLQSPVERGEYLHQLHLDTGLSEVDLRSEVGRFLGEEEPTHTAGKIRDTREDEARPARAVASAAEETLVGCLLAAPGRILKTLELLEAEDFSSPAHYMAVLWLGSLEGADPIARLHEAPPDAAQVISRMLSGEKKDDAEGKAWKDCVKQIRSAALSRRVDRLNEALRTSASEERTAIKQELTQLLAEINRMKAN